MITDNMVTWETRFSIVDWVYSKTLILLETLKTRNQPRRVQCIFGSRTVAPTSTMCKKQTSVSHSSTELEAIDPWDLVTEHLSSSERPLRKEKLMIKCREVEHGVKSRAPIPTPDRKETVTEKLMNCLMWITLSQAQFEALLYTFEDGCDQNDHKGQMSYDETRVRNPQSCVN